VAGARSWVLDGSSFSDCDVGSLARVPVMRSVMSRAEARKVAKMMASAFVPVVLGSMG
jgi:hypothetical protein